MSSTHPKDCGCCQGLTARTPARTGNRPGLPAISYRAGTHSQFKASLLARLSAVDMPELAFLTSRNDDDFSIALLDAWATMADVLTFYQERLANESYLRTAVERRSVDELARLVGYRLAPGVAAEAFLAFILEDAPGAPDQATAKTFIDLGTRVQSTPGPDETAQTFETVKPIEGRVAWNQIQPRRTDRHALTKTSLLFEGLTTQLKPGDGVFFEADNGTKVFGSIATVEPQPEQTLTRVEVRYLNTNPVEGSGPNIQQATPTVPAPAAAFLNQTLSGADLEAQAKIGKLETQAIFDALTASPQPAPRVLVFRQRAAIFGHNAAPWASLPASLRAQEPVYTTVDGDLQIGGLVAGAYQGQQNSWNDKNLPTISGTHVFLDRVFPDVAAQSQVVLRDDANNKWAIYEVENASEISHSQFNVTAKVTRLQPKNATRLNDFAIKSTTVYVQSETLPLARVPRADDFVPDVDDWLELDGWVDGLFVGQSIAVNGEVRGTGAQRAEVAEISKVQHVLTQEGGGTRIQLKPAWTQPYLRDEVRLNANVARSTHGETVEEILGSGDARRTYQEVALAQPPLTHVSAETPSGTASTLELRVNDIRWQEAETLYGRGANERVFTTKIQEDGKTAVLFGDGVNGARLPTGQNNVRARYRKGLGLGGLVRAGQLNLLMQRPLGLKEVSNPLPSSGGADPETRDEARRNAPLQVLTLNRVVSLRDYEDFARAFAGIAKARATWIWDGRERGIFLTVAGPNGNAIESGGPVYKKLVSALAKAGDPYVSVRVSTFDDALFHVALRVKVHEDYLAEKVLPAVEATLRTDFSFQARELGQPVAASEVIAAVQGVDGVVAVDLDKLYRDGTAAQWNARLAAELPRTGARALPEPGELLTLHPGPLASLEEMP